MSAPASTNPGGLTNSQAALLAVLMNSSGLVPPSLAEPSGALPELWIPVALLANIFAFYWLYR